MCGILAIFSRGRNVTCTDAIYKGGSKLQSRGPDDSKVIQNDQFMLLFYRLSIMDTSSAGNQPMVGGLSTNGNATNGGSTPSFPSSTASVYMMCNGEIYNYQELINKYQLECKSESDCEVILRLYEKVGFYQMVTELEGVFALVLIDGDDVYIARDRFGVRPLYMGRTVDGSYAVASLAKSLLDYCRTDALTTSTTSNSNSSGVQALHPGMYKLSRSEKGVNYPDKITYVAWFLSRSLIQSSLPANTPEVLIHQHLVNAVRKRLMSNREIGCLLSGGLDSSIVAYILSKLIGANNVKTYSIGMEGSTDIQYARTVASFLGTNHTEVLFTPDEAIAVIPEVIDCLESYDITTIRASIGMYLIGKYIKEQTEDRVIFSGEGSDEMFCGYLYFHYAPTPKDAIRDRNRLLSEMYKYDLLRADRTLGVHGLELREPFLDIYLYRLITGFEDEMIVPQQGYEKYILRKAFEGCLPSDVIWRRKEGFSDGTSSKAKSLYSYIQDYAATQIGNDVFDSARYPSKEAMYYRMIFDKKFPRYNLSLPYWMPRWTNSTDPSGRTLAVYSLQK